MSASQDRLVEVAVVGAGFSGIGAAIRLRKSGITDFVILEKSDDIGGTWRDNVYPDVGVDIPTWAYCFSFEPNPHWQHAYAKGHELKRYADRCVDKYGVRPHLRLGTEVTRAEFDEERHVWRLDTSRGPVEARYLINAYGGLGAPQIPDIEGLQGFSGPIVHSAEWDIDLELRGQRVGVIGTGSSSVQIIPAIAGQTKQTHVFQRTPIWVIPKPDFPVPPLMARAFRLMPALMRIPRWLTNTWIEILFYCGIRFKLPLLVTMLEKVALLMLRLQVPDPTVREKLTPSYRFGCKFPSLSNSYYRTFARDNVELVTADISRFSETGVYTADGEFRELDMLILATGFKVYDPGAMPKYPIKGRGGVELGQYLDTNRKSSYEGVTLPLLPNAFVIPGPYAVTGSYFLMIENSALHAVRCITEARRRGATCIEVKAEPHDRYLDDMLARQNASIFYNSNCERANSFYFDVFGDVPMFRPSTGIEAWWRSRRFPLDHYSFTTVKS